MSYLECSCVNDGQTTQLVQGDNNVLVLNTLHKTTISFFIHLFIKWYYDIKRTFLCSLTLFTKACPINIEIYYF